MPSLALSATTVPSSCLTSAAWVSTSWRAIESCCSSVRYRSSVTRAASSCASSRMRARSPAARRTRTGAGRWAQDLPFRTICPSLYNTFVSTPETWARTVTVAAAPRCPAHRGRPGCRRARHRHAHRGGRAAAAAAGPAARPAAGCPRGAGSRGARAGARARGGRCVRYQASAPSATSARTATAAPSQRRCVETARCAAEWRSERQDRRQGGCSCRSSFVCAKAIKRRAQRTTATMDGTSRPDPAK